MSPLRILVTGSRDWRNQGLIRETLLCALGEFTTIGPPVLIHGGQRSRDQATRKRYGADFLAGEAWTEIARKRPGWLAQPEVYPAQWTAPCRPECEPGHRRPARNAHTGGSTCPAQGHYRNQQMVDAGATICFAFPLDGSVGTWDCVRRARAAGIPVRIIAAEEEQTA
jgi:hypothetical protein